MTGREIAAVIMLRPERRCRIAWPRRRQDPQRAVLYDRAPYHSNRRLVDLVREDPFHEV